MIGRYGILSIVVMVTALGIAGRVVASGREGMDRKN